MRSAKFNPIKVSTTTANKFHVLSTIDEEIDKNEHNLDEVYKETKPLGVPIVATNESKAMHEHTAVGTQETNPKPTTDNTQFTFIATTNLSDVQNVKQTSINEPTTINVEPSYPIQAGRNDHVHVHTDTHSMLSIGDKSLFSSPTKN